YQHSESLTHCECGYELTHAVMSEVSQEELTLSALVAGMPFDSTNPLLATPEQSMRFGALQWYRLRHCHSSEQERDHEETFSISGVLDYFESWPESLWHELEQTRLSAEYSQTKAFNRTSFKEVFGSLLVSCGQLPMR